MPAPSDGWSLGRIALVGTLAIVVAPILAAHPPSALLASPFGDSKPASSVKATAGAFGLSGEVRLQLRLPGESFDFPVEITGPAEQVSYQWLKAEDSSAVVPPAPLHGVSVAAPPHPGFYRLAVLRESGTRLVDSVVVGVMAPFSSKLGGTLNGYQIGTYRWERARDDASPPPRGFLELFPEDTAMAVSTHFRMADFLTHDGQETWPRYVALDSRILDKVELVLSYLGSHDRIITMDVHSGFRSPVYNRRVPRAASDSRHQYGDAADLAIDADGDGKVTYFDGLAVAHAVEEVEREHPELVGGLGLYGNHGDAAYVHIDERGTRKRWKG
jgi:uncharacterized protein YcbK (DUF882 family)